MKVYTIINSFSVGEYRENDECTIMNFLKKEDALKAFKKIMTSHLGDGEVVWVDDEEVTYDKLFDNLLTCGYGHKVEDDYIWVRCEDVKESFDEEDVVDTFGLVETITDK